MSLCQQLKYFTDRSVEIAKKGGFNSVGLIHSKVTTDGENKPSIVICLSCKDNFNLDDYINSYYYFEIHDTDDGPTLTVPKIPSRADREIKHLLKTMAVGIDQRDNFVSAAAAGFVADMDAKAKEMGLLLEAPVAAE